MAAVEPLRALHYDVDRLGGLQDVLAPPYDVIDGAQRARLEARSPYNVVRIDLPVGENRYQTAARTLAEWKREGVIDSARAGGSWRESGSRSTAPGVSARTSSRMRPPSRIGSS